MRRIVPLILFAAVASCDPTGNTNVSSDAASVRLANFLTDTPSVTLSTVGLPIIADIPFGEPSSYEGVDVNVHALDLTRTNDAFPIESDSVNLIPGRHYTLYALGIATAFKSKFATDDTVFAATGNVKVRFLHGVKAQFTHGIDLYVSLPADDDLTLLTPIVPALAYGSASAYVAVDTSLTRVRLTLAGSTTTIFDSTFAGAIADRSVVTVVASDKIGGGAPVRLQIVLDKEP